MSGALSELTASRALRRSWLRSLGDHDDVVQLPTDYREDRGRVGLSELEIGFPETCGRRLVALRATEPLVQSLVLSAIGLAAQARLSGTIVVGVPWCSRDREVTEDLLPILVPFRPDQTLEALWRSTHRTLEGALARANAARRGELAKILTTQTGIRRVDLRLGFNGRRTTLGGEAVPLQIEAAWSKDRLSAKLLYRTDLFAASTMGDLARDIGLALDRLVHDPQVRVRDDPAAASADALSGDSTASDPRGVFERFSDVAERMPAACALVCRDVEVTYEELSDRVEACAAGLSARGIEAGTTVALHLRPGVDLISCIMAAHRLGAIYVLLADDHPVRRLSEIIADTGAALVVTDHPGSVPDTWAAIHPAELSGAAHLRLPPVSGPQASFGVFYTSSSTGRAKCVALREAALLNRLVWMWARFPFTDGDKLLLQKSPAVVGALWEIYGGLLAGVPTVIAETRDIADPDRFAAFVGRHGITRIAGSPPILENLIVGSGAEDGTASTLRIVYSSADALTPELVHRWRRRFPTTRLLNLYGSTECSSNATWFDATDLSPHADRVPIGKPIANVKAYVLTRDLKAVPPGGIGELCISGACLAAGYRDGDHASEGRFITNPFASDDGTHQTLYRTGDLARINEHRDVELLGRIDHTVKLRGFRVALGDVEVALKAHPAVEDAIATVTESVGRRRVLHAFYRSDEQLDRGALRSHLSERIPGFMIPNTFSRLDEFPKTRSGKVDRRALSASVARPGARPNMDLRSRQGLEQFIRLLWQDVSGADDVQPDDRIMDVGIDSLAIVDIQLQLQKATGCRLELSDLFQYPTPRTLTGRILNGGDDGTSVASARSRAAMRRAARNG